jgi:hypothetical protein
MKYKMLPLLLLVPFASDKLFSQNVGIDTVTPQKRLEVYSNISSNPLRISSYQPGISLYNTTTTTEVATISSSGNLSIRNQYANSGNHQTEQCCISLF